MLIGRHKTGEDIVDFLLERYGSRINVNPNGSRIRVTRNDGSGKVVQIPKGRLDGTDRKLRQYISGLELNVRYEEEIVGLADYLRAYLKTKTAIGLENAVPIEGFTDVYGGAGKSKRNLAKFLGERSSYCGVKTEGNRIYLVDD
ncbi:MAG: hypothetical protein COY38_02680 [Candidatus Aenigmarchaeota archaeon CG_4_10_14_0_8_um_filter_37_24]|nr:hypothetical protein [Candidatus Aenigmarchaeota archaeon]OIN88439.1 MAG: hypothetical protein AUJ50_01005 [Candidatus Aenigmarchaeota archaeon CG1_02_38_14]PIV68413.1 MAG: hypothetical protein COS07_04130 [Candidatus Aenigmarchaeota archaeon CG01_land_8_20_14_3_00_37_9]PIX50858.1 MAG: hypothetical protein COZ52_02045 [Candidatus Aenigmarchaeota archaeon CG_4_8_14_3_um_filter_37_24]PIY36271.1 MAG: hypothetical protein COZ04_00810 [Candidatus Aenigmarchaeota archaeon CG_4_10_14_3_um_filter_37